MNIVLCSTPHFYKLHNCTVVHPSSPQVWGRLHKLQNKRIIIVLCTTPHLYKFDLICTSCIANQYCTVSTPYLYKFDLICTSYVLYIWVSPFICTGEYCTLSSITSLHANKCSSSTWLCNMLIVSGSFPTELADIHPLQVFCSIP